MHYLLVGPGALGSLLYSLISSGSPEGDRFTILDYNKDRAEFLAERGIVYHKDDSTRRVVADVISDPGQLNECNHVDVVLLCVKSYDVKNSLQYCDPILSDRTLLLFMQNGIAHLDLPDCPYRAAAAYGTTTEGATLLRPGHVRHAGSGETFIGFLTEPNDHFRNLLAKTRDVFLAGGLRVQLTDDILTRIWAKLFINVGINALTATLDCKNGELLDLSGVPERMKRAVEEAVQVAETKNIPVLKDPYLITRDVCKKTAANISSMLQDIHRKRRTEIDAINGAIVELGKELGIKTPENELLRKQVKELESTYLHHASSRT